MISVLMVTVVVASAVAIYLDTTGNKIGKQPGVKSFWNMSAGEWASMTLLLWILTFPVYVLKRSKLLAVAREAPIETLGRAGKTILLAAIGLIWIGATARASVLSGGVSGPSDSVRVATPAPGADPAVMARQRGFRQMEYAKQDLRSRNYSAAVERLRAELPIAGVNAPPGMAAMLRAYELYLEHPDAADAFNASEDHAEQTMRQFERFRLAGPGSPSVELGLDLANQATYRQLERNPNGFIGSQANFVGKVLEIQDVRGGSVMRVGINAYATDDLWVEAQHVDSDVLRDERVRILGYYAAAKTYETQIGGFRTIPAVNARAVLLEAKYQRLRGDYEGWNRSRDAAFALLRAQACQLDAQYGIGQYHCE
jgi:hypothetical protein